MPARNGTWKAAVALIATLLLGGGGVAGYYKLQADAVWHERAIETLRVKHDSDITCVEGKFTATKVTLDTILQRTASNQAKLDMLVEMVRDMRANGGGSN